MTMDSGTAALDETLKHRFGFDTFRPLQREIVEVTLSGRDVVALLPTGGGKSLTYQLPAVMRPGLTLVISPLIALMKDQVDALNANGIAATFLNSSIDGRTAAQRIAELERGAYALLYVAPERLAVPDFLERLAGWNLQRIAVDEAHCVSEWGHDFRPEYRQIAALRECFPNVPMLAVTATATDHVRDDIEYALGLRAPERFVGSFNRANLHYGVLEKRDAFKQLLAFASQRASESGIVYASSRQSVEDLAEKLNAAGISAVPYHAGLPSEERARNQERFIRDDVRVVCATIAFGMGIDKPNVRYVVHFDVPKNVEGYYQETGRAGRDGLPSECVLFFSGGDAAKQRFFINQIGDANERERASRLLARMLDYAAITQCRRAFLLRYFGEPVAESTCGRCDNCDAPPETIDGTIAAQKFLSCLYRIRTHGGFATGAHHAIDVLLGNATEKVTGWGHQTLSTFGIGTEFSRDEWLALLSELLRLGYVEQEPAHRTLLLTAAGREALRERPNVAFAKPRILRGRSKRGKRTTSIATPASFEEALFEELRALRKRLADEAGVPPYVVFSDKTLREMAAEKPTTAQAFLKINGVGDTKLVKYGDVFSAAIRDYGKAK